MPAELTYRAAIDPAENALGPHGPFPNTPMRRVLERRWLHYAFISDDQTMGMVANVAWLGPAEPEGETRVTSILLVHRKGEGWRSTQYNARTLAPLWSAFRQPHAMGEAGPLEIASTSGDPWVRLGLTRTSHPCTSQCAPFAGNHHLRWQSETGVRAKGDWSYGGRVYRNVSAIGYHERVRGNWGWPELGGWVFGFANDPRMEGQTPANAIVFTLIQPLRPEGSATASVMVWRAGRLVKHFPRRRVSVAVRGVLDRGFVKKVPDLANLFSVPATSAIPQRLVIHAEDCSGWVLLDFVCDEAARVVIPSETSQQPFSVHEVIGPVQVEGKVGGRAFRFATHGIVEFAGGAGGD